MSGGGSGTDLDMGDIVTECDQALPSCSLTRSAVAGVVGVRDQSHGGGSGACKAGGGGRWRDHGVAGDTGDPGTRGVETVRGRVGGDPPQGRGRGGGGRETRGERGVAVTWTRVITRAGDPVQTPNRVESRHIPASDPLLIYSKMNLIV